MGRSPGGPGWTRPSGSCSPSPAGTRGSGRRAPSTSTGSRSAASARAAEMLRWLHDHGFELGNHTFDHIPFSRLSANEAPAELALGKKLITDAVPGAAVRTLALPLGAMPKPASLARAGEWNGISYRNDGIFLVGAEPAPSPFSASFDAGAIPRIRTGGAQFGSTYWLDEPRAPSGAALRVGRRSGQDHVPAVVGGRARAALPRPRAGVLIRVAVIGAGLDLGQERRGVDMGPSAIRYAGLEARSQELGIECEDWGNVAAAVPEAVEPHDERAPLPPRGQGDLRRRRGARRRGRRARACIAARARRRPLDRARERSAAWRGSSGPGGVLWVDAHADLNTPGHLADGERPRDGARRGLGLGGAGVREPGLAAARRRPRARRAGGHPHARRGRARSGCASSASASGRSARSTAAASSALQRGARPRRRRPAGSTSRSTWTCVDPDVAPGVGTPVRGGLSYREAHLAMELVAEPGSRPRWRSSR